MINLSLCMITKNEEKNIERCLKSVDGLVNEIIIIDTGSTDRTIEIAESLNANVLGREFNPFSFSKARNVALALAWGKWILHLDADEELPEESRLIIEKIIETDKKQGYICNVVNDLPDNEMGVFKSIRFFKNEPGVCYARDCHEEIYFSLNKLNYEIVESDIKIIHHGYNAPKEVLEAKAQRNLNLLLKMYGKSCHWLTAYQIGQSYCALEDYKTGKEYFHLALSHPLITDQFRKEIQNIILAVG